MDSLPDQRPISPRPYVAACSCGTRVEAPTEPEFQARLAAHIQLPGLHLIGVLGWTTAG